MQTSSLYYIIYQIRCSRAFCLRQCHIKSRVKWNNTTNSCLYIFRVNKAFRTFKFYVHFIHSCYNITNTPFGTINWTFYHRKHEWEEDFFFCILNVLDPLEFSQSAYKEMACLQWLEFIVKHAFTNLVAHCCFPDKFTYKRA